jgi:hypothetical protein
MRGSFGKLSALVYVAKGYFVRGPTHSVTSLATVPST